MSFIFIFFLIATFFIQTSSCASENNQKPLEKYRRVEEISVPDFIKKYPSTKKIIDYPLINFNYPSFPVASTQDHPDFSMQGALKDICVLEIPHGIVFFNEFKQCFINNCYLDELRIKINSRNPTQKYKNWPVLNAPIKNIKGTVAIVHHCVPSVYGHFIFDILGMLALFEVNNVSYDHLCIPYDKPFMKQLLQLWGIKPNKIIPIEKKLGFQATKVILPTSLSRDSQGVRVTSYYPPGTLMYVRNKLLQKCSNQSQIAALFNPKVFISRTDASYRNLPNEDEIYELFKQRGYTRYRMSDLSVLQQIVLFHNATHIVGPAGSNMTNILFARAGTRYLEFTQTMPDATFFVVAHLCGLLYHNVSDSTIFDVLQGNPMTKGRNLDPQLVRNFIEQHPEF